MDKNPGKSSSIKIINSDKQGVALGKQKVRTACPKDQLEFKFFSRPVRCCPHWRDLVCPLGDLQLAIKTCVSPEVEFAGPRLSERFFSHALETYCKPIKGLVKTALLGSDLLCRRNGFKWFLT